MIPAEGVLPVETNVQSLAHVEVRPHADVPPDGVGVEVDALTLYVSEGDAGVVSLSGLGESNVGRVGDSSPVELLKVHPKLPRSCLTISRIRGIPRIVRDVGLSVKLRSPRCIIIVVIVTLPVQWFQSGIHPLLPMEDRHLVVVKSVATAIELLHLGVEVRILPEDCVADRDDRLSRLGTLGGDDDRTVTALRTVERGGCRSLEDIDALHIVHIEGILIGDDAIDHVDRLCTGGVIE